MRNRINQMMGRLSLFWRNFFALALVAGIFLVSMLVSDSRSTQALRESYLDHAHTSFEQNCELFSRDLFLGHALPPTLENTDEYTQIVNITQEQLQGRVYPVSVLHDAYMRQCAMLGMPAEGFVYFKRSGISFTHSRLFSGDPDCFESYLMYDASVMGAARDAVMGYDSMTLQLLPVCPIGIGGKTPEPYLTVLARGSSRDVVYGYLYSEESILEYFHMEALPEDTWLQLRRSDGTVLYAHGREQEQDYALMSAQMPALSCTATIGIPQSYFRQIISQAQGIAQLIFLFSVVTGVLLCIYFSHASVKPFRRLIQSHTGGQRLSGKPSNELVVIDNFLRSARQKNAALRSMLLSSLLMRAYSGAHIPEDEYEKLASDFPMFQQPMQVAVVRDREGGKSQQASASMIDRLQDVLPEQFLCEYINIQEAVILFQAEEGSYELLQRAMMELNLEHEQESRFVCGVSAPFVGLSQTGTAIRQAQFCVPEADERVVVHFVEDSAAGADSATDIGHGFKQFQQALASWSQQEVLDQIEYFALHVGKNGTTRPEEVFYSALFLLRDAAYSGKISFEAHEKTAYLHTSSPMDNLRRLKQIANDLFDQKAALLLSDKQQLCEEIVQHIRENFGDANLCLASLAQQFCVSERFVYNAVQSVAGMNFSSYITATRMQEAARLLRETDENIGAVAARCGYPVESTFYRNFKKYYHITPVEYKNSAR